MNKEWSLYTPKDPDCEASSDWLAIDVLRHTAHLSAARRIAEDKQITSNLIYDGKLKHTRTKGVFLSPNHWSEGYVYGSIQFAIPANKILSGKQLYWVEVVKDYSIPIFRFFASGSNNIPQCVKKYDPKVDDGPIREMNNTLYRTKEYVVEIILDEDVPVSSCEGLQFVSHHHEYCIRKLKDCPEKRAYQQAWAALTGFLISSSLTSLNPLLCSRNTLTTEAQTGLRFLWHGLTKGNITFGGSVGDLEQARNVVQAAMLNVFDPVARKRGRALVAMLETEEIFNRAFEASIREHFEIPDFCISELGD